MIQVVETEGRQVLRINITPTTWGWQDTIFGEVIDPAAPRILEGDIIDILGEVRGRITYTAIVGQQVTLPHVARRYVTVIGEDI